MRLPALGPIGDAIGEEAGRRGHGPGQLDEGIVVGQRGRLVIADDDEARSPLDEEGGDPLEPARQVDEDVVEAGRDRLDPLDRPNEPCIAKPARSSVEPLPPSTAKPQASWRWTSGRRSSPARIARRSGMAGAMPN